MKRTFWVTFEYYKDSGKYYGTANATVVAHDLGSKLRGGVFSSPSCPMLEVEKWLREQENYPGLQGKWDGPIRIDCEQGYPVLLLNKGKL